MAINIINQPEASAPYDGTDYTQQNLLINSALSQGDHILKDWKDSGVVPSIKQGTVIFHSANMYSVDSSDAPITGDTVDGVNYIRLTASGSVLTASFITDLTGYVWNPVWNGYYNGTSLVIKAIIYKIGAANIKALSVDGVTSGMYILADGTLISSNASFSASISGVLKAVSATITGALSAASATIIGLLTAGSATITGALSAASAIITGALSTGSIISGNTTVNGTFLPRSPGVAGSWSLPNGYTTIPRGAFAIALSQGSSNSSFDIEIQVDGMSINKNYYQWFSESGSGDGTPFTNGGFVFSDGVNVRFKNNGSTITAYYRQF